MRRSHLHIGWLFLVSFSFLIQVSKAQSPEKWEVFHKGSSFSEDSTRVVEDDKFQTSIYSYVTNTYRVKDVIALRIVENEQLQIPDSFSCEVNLKIVWTDEQNTDHTEFKTLRVCHNSAQLYHDTLISLYEFSGAHIVVDSIIEINTTGLSTPLPDIFLLTSSIEIERQFDFSCSLYAYNIDTSYLADEDELNVSWTTLGHNTGVPYETECDFEWTFYDDSSELIKNYLSGGSHPYTDAAFRRNATRVVTSEYQYRIPLLFENGYVMFRIRPVQVLPSGQRIEGEWTTTTFQGSSLFIFHVSGHEVELNWQAATTFAEEGKRKSVVNYFDGSSKNRQSVTKINSDSITIVGETIYDVEGRPVVTTLPAPTFEKAIQHYDFFNIDSLGNPYSWRDLDVTAGCSPEPAIMDTSSGSSLYYSANNPLKDNSFHQFIPDAFGYPFSQTQYTNDLTNRVRRSAGPGKDHHMGPLPERVTQYYYASPEESELERLFGAETGVRSHYFKNMVLDPNGQISVTYQDMHGRTIATSLAGDTNSTNLERVSDFNSPVILRDAIIDSSSRSIEGLSIKASKTFLVETEGTHKFYYSLFPESMMITACDSSDYCFDCVYDLTITLTDDCGNSKLPGDTAFKLIKYNYTPATDLNYYFDTTCAQEPVPIVDSFELSLPVGEYTVDKELTIKSEAIDYYYDFYTRNDTCIKKFDDFYQDALSQIDFSGCDLTCEECLAHLGDSSVFVQNFLQTIIADDTSYILTASDTGNARFAYLELRNTCKLMCDSFNLCDQKRELLLFDMSPTGGQYATYEVDRNNQTYTVSDQASIFYPNSTLFGTTYAFYSDPNLVYRDELGMPDTLHFDIDDNGIIDTVVPNQLSVAQFIQYWKSSWAETLLPYHPEYCDYEYCVSISSSHDYDQAMLAIDNYDTAKAYGFLNPLNESFAISGFGSNTVNQDPFFSSTFGSDFLNLMKQRMEVYFSYDTIIPPSTSDSVKFSIWDIAAHSVECTSSSQSAACFECKKQYYWNAFRNMYLGIKRFYVDQAMINNYITNCSTTNPTTYLDFNTTPLLGKAARFELLQDNLGLPLTNIDTNAILQQVHDSIDNNAFNFTCRDYANYWWGQLQGCDFSNFSQNDSALLIDELIAVCELGRDDSHPYGASTTPSPTIVTANGNSSFEDVLQWVDSILPYWTYHPSDSCTHFLITNPQAYKNHTVYYQNVQIEKPDSCVCNNINDYYQEYLGTIDSSDTVSFSQYLTSQKNIVISEDDIQVLLNSCNDSICDILKHPVSLPYEFGCDKVCVNCYQVITAFEAFKQEFPNAYLSPNNQTLIQAYLNETLDMNLTSDEYIMFMYDSCGYTAFPSDTVGSTSCFPPEAYNDSIQVSTGCWQSIPLLDNDIYPVGSVIHILQSGNGVVTVNGNDATYRVDAVWASSTDTISYSLCNSCGQCDTATILVDVGSQPCNNPVIAVEDFVSLCLNDTITINLTANDVNADEEGLFMQSAIVSNSDADITVDYLNISVTGVHVGLDTLVYVVCDSDWNTCDTGFATIVVMPCDSTDSTGVQYAMKPPSNTGRADVSMTSIGGFLDSRFTQLKPRKLALVKNPSTKGIDFARNKLNSTTDFYNRPQWTGFSSTFLIANSLKDTADVAHTLKHYQALSPTTPSGFYQYKKPEHPDKGPIEEGYNNIRQGRAITINFEGREARNVQNMSLNFPKVKTGKDNALNVKTEEPITSTTFNSSGLADLNNSNNTFGKLLPDRDSTAFPHFDISNKNRLSNFSVSNRMNAQGIIFYPMGTRNDYIARYQYGLYAKQNGRLTALQQHSGDKTYSLSNSIPFKTRDGIQEVSSPRLYQQSTWGSGKANQTNENLDPQIAFSISEQANWCDSISAAIRDYDTVYVQNGDFYLGAFTNTLNVDLGVSYDIHDWLIQLDTCGIPCPYIINCNRADSVINDFKSNYPAFADSSLPQFWSFYLNNNNGAGAPYGYNTDQWIELLNCCDIQYPTVDTPVAFCDSLDQVVNFSEVSGYYSPYTFAEIANEVFGDSHYDDSSQSWISNNLQYWADHIDSCNLSCPSLIDCNLTDSILNEFYSHYPQFSDSCLPSIWVAYLNQYANSLWHGYSHSYEEWKFLLNCCGVNYPIPAIEGNHCDSLSTLADYFQGSADYDNRQAWAFVNMANDALGSSHYDDSLSTWVGNDLSYWIGELDSCGTSCSEIVQCGWIDTVMQNFYGEYPTEVDSSPTFMWVAYLNSHSGYWFTSNEWLSILNCCGISYPVNISEATFCDSLRHSIDAYDSSAYANYGLATLTNYLGGVFGWFYYADGSDQEIYKDNAYWINVLDSCGICPSIINCNLADSIMGVFTSTYPQLADSCLPQIWVSFLNQHSTLWYGYAYTENEWEYLLNCCGVNYPIATTLSGYCDSLTEYVSYFNSSSDYSSHHLWVFTDMVNSAFGLTHYDDSLGTSINNSLAYWLQEMDSCNIPCSQVLVCSYIDTLMSNFYSEYPSEQDSSPAFIWVSYLNQHSGFGLTEPDWIAMFNCCGVSYPISEQYTNFCDSLHAAITAYDSSSLAFEGLSSLTNYLKGIFGYYHYDENTQQQIYSDDAYWLSVFDSCNECPAIVSCDLSDSVMNVFKTTYPQYADSCLADLWVNFMNQNYPLWNGYTYTYDEWVFLLNCCDVTYPGPASFTHCDSLELYIGQFYNSNDYTSMYVSNLVSQLQMVFGSSHYDDSLGTWVSHDFKYWLTEMDNCSIPCSEVVQCSHIDTVLQNFYNEYPTAQDSAPAFLWANYLNQYSGYWFATDDWIRILNCCNIPYPDSVQLNTYCDSIGAVVNAYASSSNATGWISSMTDYLSGIFGWYHWNETTQQYNYNDEVYWLNIMDSCGICSSIIDCNTADSIMTEFKTTNPQYADSCFTPLWVNYFNQNSSLWNGYTYSATEWMFLLNCCNVAYPDPITLNGYCDTLQWYATAFNASDDYQNGRTWVLTSQLQSSFGYAHYDSLGVWVNNDFGYWLGQLDSCGIPCTEVINCGYMDTLMQQFYQTYPANQDSSPVFLWVTYLNQSSGNWLNENEWINVLGCCNITYPTPISPVDYCDSLSQFVTAFNSSTLSGYGQNNLINAINNIFGWNHWDEDLQESINHDLAYWLAEFDSCNISCPNLINCYVADSIMNLFKATFPQYADSCSMETWVNYMNNNNAGNGNWYSSDEWVLYLNCCGINYPVPVPQTFCDIVSDAIDYFNNSGNNQSLWDFETTMGNLISYGYNDSLGNWVSYDYRHWFEIIDSCNLPCPNIVDCNNVNGLLQDFFDAHPDLQDTCPAFVWINYLNENDGGNGYWYNTEQWEALLNCCGVSYPYPDTLASYCDTVSLLVNVGYDSTSALPIVGVIQTIGPVFGQYYNDTTGDGPPLEYWLGILDSCGYSCSQFTNCSLMDSVLSEFLSDHPQYADSCPDFVITAYFNQTFLGSLEKDGGSYDDWVTLYACCGISLPPLDTTPSLCDTMLLYTYYFDFIQSVVVGATGDSCVPAWLYSFALQNDESDPIQMSEMCVQMGECGLPCPDTCVLSTYCDSLWSVYHIYTDLLQDMNGEEVDPRDPNKGLTDFVNMIMGSNLTYEQIMTQLVLCDTSVFCDSFAIAYQDLDTLVASYSSCIPVNVYTSLLNGVTGLSLSYLEWCNLTSQCSIQCPDTCQTILSTSCDTVLEAYDLYLRVISLYQVGDSAKAMSNMFSALFGYYVSSDTAQAWISECDTSISCDDILDLSSSLEPLFSSYDTCVPAWVVELAFNFNVENAGPPYTYAQICAIFSSCGVSCPDTCGGIGPVNCDSIQAIYNLYENVLSIYPGIGEDSLNVLYGMENFVLGTVYDYASFMSILDSCSNPCPPLLQYIVPSLQPFFDSFGDCVPTWLVELAYSSTLDTTYTYEQVCTLLTTCGYSCPDTCDPVPYSCDSILQIEEVLNNYLSVYYDPYFTIDTQEISYAFTYWVLGDSLSYEEFLDLADSCKLPDTLCAYADSIMQQVQVFLDNHPGVLYQPQSLFEQSLYSYLDNYFYGHRTKIDWCDSLQACGDTCPLTIYSPLLCNRPLLPPISGAEEDSCFEIEEEYAYHNAAAAYEDYLSNLHQEFINSYIEKCLGAYRLENFEYEHPNSEYHFTLYYYDQAGNLVKTIPPNGVDLDSQQHTFPTVYRYNTLNQVVEQRTPDAGTTRFWYDRIGKLVFSRNAKQELLGQMSYTIYDQLQRIIEVGKFDSLSVAYYNSWDYIAQLPIETWYPQVIGSASNIVRKPTELTRTYYDEDKIGISSLFGSTGQQFLRNRVASATYEDEDDYDSTTYQAASHYSYDVHGNVNVLLQEDQRLKVIGQDLKRLDYQYDLISGKVNRVIYQQDKPDQFIHVYEYDADNRIVDVLTSRDSTIFDKDAYYQYYLHGPLARLTLGEHQVQGVDYAYTIQGWLKMINGSLLSAAREMGQDGNTSGDNQLVARDQYAYTLGYYNSDYQPIAMGGTLTGYNQPEAFYSSLNQFGLYNGNIAHTVADIKALNQDPQAYVYRYDQLNRLTQMHVANNSIANIDNWTFKNDYNERIGYDPNGNILNYWRNGTTSGGSPLAMDSLTYHYQPGTNKLDYVDDAVDAANYSVDIDDEDTLNYRYDAIGNLTKDVSEGIDTILWNVYGKIQEIDKANGDTLHFAYDATGNRIMKEYWNDSLQKRTHTFYVRDATGNIMATYLWENMDTFKLDELVMYGSSRLGVIHPDRILYTDSLGSDTTMPDITSYATNFKQYELTNHLGNVLVTIGDRKLPVYVSGAYNHYEAEAVSANDYYPFGMLMPGRGYTTGSGYRFGFNGQEKVDEISGSGNHNTALFWEYDTRLGRRWNQDPKPNPSISDYATFANNPIWFNDPLGDIFKIGTKDKQAKTDVTNQVKTKNQKYLKFQEDGEVKADFGGLSQKKIDKILKKDEGLSLINNLSTAKDDKGNDINFFYGTEGDVGARDRTTGEKLDIPFPAHPAGYETTKPDFFLNLSVTPYSAENPYILPKEGFQGQVMVAPGYGTVSEQQNVYNNQGEVTGTKTVLRNVRSEIIFHELRENYLRTVNKLPYKEAHEKAGGIGEINSFIFK